MLQMSGSGCGVFPERRFVVLIRVRAWLDNFPGLKLWRTRKKSGVR
jgi:hypothetical protein